MPLAQILLRCAAAAAVLATAACAGGPNGRMQRLRAQLAPSPAAERPVLVIAHRGCWLGSAENSIASIKICAKAGVDAVELDVRRTADGVLILMHDERVDRTTNGQGRVSDLTYDQIAALRLKAGAGGPQAALTAEAPPTFEAAMKAAKGRLLVNLDAKADVYDDAFAVLQRTGTTRQIIMKRRVAPGEAPLATQAPFDKVFAMPIAEQTLGAPGALLGGQMKPAPVAAELVFTDYGYLVEAAPLVRGAGARVWVNTLRPQFAAGLVDDKAATDPDAVWGRLVASGVTMIQTDRPVELTAYLKSKGYRRGL